MQVKALLGAGLIAGLGAPAEAAPCRPAKAVTYEARLDGTRVVVCFEHGPHACWGLPLAAPTWAPLPATACGAQLCGSDPPRSKIPSSAIVTACAPDGSACHTVATPLAVGLEAVTDGALVAAIEDARITVADVHTGAVVATIAPWSHPDNSRGWSFRSVQFIGPDRLFLELGDGDTTYARLFTARTGATALTLAGNFDRAPPTLFRNELVLAAAGSTELVLVELDHLARRSLPLFAKPGPLTVLVATPGAIVAVQNGGDGSVAIADGVATTVVPGPPACP